MEFITGWTSTVSRTLQRLRSDERWLAADLAIRGFGGALLGLCAAVACWLYRSVHRAPAHPASALELILGLAVASCWVTGWAALGQGQGLFRLIEVPGRPVHFHPVDRGVTP